MVILCYHKVGPVSEEGRRLNIEPERLASHVRWFKRRGWRFLTAGDLADPWPAPAVVLTFDDAYVSSLTHGVEVLLSYGVTGSMYAVTDCVGSYSTWDVGNERPLADWDLLRKAQAKGIEIGNHSDAHPFLGRISEDRQLAHIQRAHERMLQEGLSPQSFCFPYGSVNKESARAVERAGYKVGLGLAKRNPRASDDLRVLPRVVVAYSDGVAGLIYKLSIKPRLYRLIGRA